MGGDGDHGGEPVVSVQPDCEQSRVVDLEI